MQGTNKFEIHYFLQSSSHSMDAIVRNKCEAQVIALAYEVIRILNLEIRLEAEACQEGGLKETWKFLGDNGQEIAALTGILTLLLGGVGLGLQYAAMAKSPKENELIDLTLEEKKLNIQKLKSELAANKPTEETVKCAADEIGKNNTKVITHKSNFYKQLSHYPKVTDVGFSQLDANNKPIAPETIIPRSEFPKFILQSSKLPVEIIEDARIEIVAPILRGTKTKWRGIYIDIDPISISFEMNDKIFKEAVLSKQISFKNGDVIICVLEIHREFNEAGDIIIKRYSVPTVLDKIENNTKKETLSGKKFRREKELTKAQRSLDF